MTTRALQVVGVLAGAAATLTICVAAALLDDKAWGLIWIGYPVVGAGILARRPSNRLGWLMVAMGCVWAASLVVTAEVTDGTWRSPLAETWVDAFSGIGFLFLVAIVVCFPSGRAQTRWDRWIIRLLMLAAVVLVGAWMTSDEPMMWTGRPNPWAVPALGTFDSLLIGPGFLLVVVLLIAALYGMVRRWRATSGAERLQFRWLLLGTAVAAVVLALSFFFVDQTTVATLIPIAAGMSCIPAAIWVAVLRYHLYDIDRVISRTASYAIVTGVLLATYAVIVTSVTRVLPDSSTLAVATATLTAAALARPVYRRIQHAVARRFNRARYDAERTVDDFGARLRHEVDTALVSSDLLGIVRQTLQPEGVNLWLNDRP